jgi:hypothetical protein
MVCPQCGSEAQGNFCANCGGRLTPPPPPPAAIADTAQASPSLPAATAASPAAVATPALPVPVLSGGSTPVAVASSTCPVCKRAALAEKTVKTVLGLHTTVEFVCPACAAVLVDRGGDPRHLQLASCAQTAEAVWQTYAHHTLTIAEWQRIAAGGASDEKQQELDLAEAMAKLRRGQVQVASDQQAPILLKSGEQVVFVIPGIVLREPRSVSRGVYGGPSIHIAKGVSFRVGGFQAQSHEELKDVDTGTLVLTSKRLAFAGQMRSVECDLAKLISVEAYSDAVAVRRTGKERTEFFCGLDHFHYQFTVDGRTATERFSGLILKYAIEGLLNPAQ